MGTVITPRTPQWRIWVDTLAYTQGLVSDSFPQFKLEVTLCKSCKTMYVGFPTSNPNDCVCCKSCGVDLFILDDFIDSY